MIESTLAAIPPDCFYEDRIQGLKFIKAMLGEEGRDIAKQWYKRKEFDQTELDEDWQSIDMVEPVSHLADGIYTAADIDINTIPRRDWVYDKLVLSGYLSAVIAPGGTGKSVLTIVMAISVALGRSLFDGHEVEKARPVLLLNNEDDQDELNRRIVAVCEHFEIKPDELNGRLFVRSGYKNPLMVARNGMTKKVVKTDHCSELIEFVRQKNIGLIIADPYVSFHDVAENDNTLQNEVVKVFRYICAETKAAVLLVAHTKKLGGDSTLRRTPTVGHTT